MTKKSFVTIFELSINISRDSLINRCHKSETRDMRHQKKSQKFHRTEEERRRLWIDLSTALIKYGQITTFSARAKWFRSKFERLITLVRRSEDDVQLAYRKVRPFLKEEEARKLIEEIVPQYKDRVGGYTQVFQLSAVFSDHQKSLVRLTPTK